MLRLGVALIAATLVGCGSDDDVPSSGGGAGQSGAGGASGSGGASGGTAGVGGGFGGTSGAGGNSSGGSAGQAGSGEAGAAPCTSNAGPSMVAVPGYCIDSTEVTQAHYAAFLADVAGDPPVQRGACSWNTSLEPALDNTGVGDDLPVRGVDWCDAFLYCDWAGKRLCGSISGGPNPYAAAADPTSGQWYAACSAAGTKAFPYGDSYQEQACNGGDYGDPEIAPLAVGSVATCVGGYPGIHDMAANVWEWEDSCEADIGASDLCRARGGGFGNGGDLHRCDYAGFFPARDFTGPVGIRCCSL